MKINYCLPVIKENKAEILNLISEQKNNYQYFEIWIDYVEDVDKIFIGELLTILENKLIILFRRKNLETILIDIQKRFDIIELLNGTGAYVDLDVTQKAELEYIKDNYIKVNTIVSYHNYQLTPSDDELLHVIKKMEQYLPKIYKVATMCNDENDALRLLQLQQMMKKETKEHIILGMGKFGTITRVFGTLWGNEMIFSPISTEENSAPGQLTKPEMEKIFDTLITKN